MSTLTNGHAAPTAASDPSTEHLATPELDLTADTGAVEVRAPESALATSSGAVGDGGFSSRHMAMPRLLGAPAYARPPRLVAETPRPLDRDDLPIEAMRSPEDEARLSAAYQQPVVNAELALKPSSQGGLRAVASRLFG